MPSTKKAVKFDKQESSPDKKKFVKTPHSSKVEKEGIQTLVKKKRKLNFSNLEDGAPKKKFARSSRRRTAEEAIRHKQENTIFVGNLPRSMNHHDVAECFSEFGKVISSRIRCVSLSDDAKNRKSGCILKQVKGDTVAAYVKFAEPESALKALKANGVVFEGHHLRVDMEDPVLKPTTNSMQLQQSVFVRHLGYEMSEDDLWRAFKKCGEIISVKVIKDSNYQSRGFAYVTFNSTGAVQLALKLDGMKIKTQQVNVLPCRDMKKKEKKKGTWKTRLAASKNNKKSKQQVNSNDFAGKIASKKNKKAKKVDVIGKKKKRLAEILTK